MITQKPPSAIVEEGQNLTMTCQATGNPTPTINWRKLYGRPPPDRIRVEKGKLSIVNVTQDEGGDYICSAKNLLNEDSALAQVVVLKALKFAIIPPHKLVAKTLDMLLNCSAQGAREVLWQRTGQGLPAGHIVYSNGSLLLKNVSPYDGGSYTCIARNFHRFITASTMLEVGRPTSCSQIKTFNRGKSSGNYMIDPDGKGGVTPFSVYCDMSDKRGAGVTVISHDSESRTHVGNIPGCSTSGCYSKDVRYTGVTTAQLAALTRVSQNCEQFIKFECKNDVEFVEKSYAWWVSRDGTQMNYWGGATGSGKMCACGVTNSCSSGGKCNCYNGGSG